MGSVTKVSTKEICDMEVACSLETKEIDLRAFSTRATRMGAVCACGQMETNMKGSLDLGASTGRASSTGQTGSDMKAAGKKMRKAGRGYSCRLESSATKASTQAT